MSERSSLTQTPRRSRATFRAMAMLSERGIPGRPKISPWPRPRALEGRSGPRPRLVDLGQLRPLFGEGPLNAYLRWALDQGRDFVVYVGASPRVLLIEPESIRKVLTGGEDFVRNSASVGRAFGESLLRLDGDPWKQRRALYRDVFRAPNLDAAVDIVQSECDNLIARWSDRKGEAFRPNRELTACLLQIISRYLFGLGDDLATPQGWHRALVTLANDVVFRHFIPWPAVAMARSHARAVEEARAKLDEMCEGILRDGGPTPYLSALRGAMARGEVDRATVLDELRTFLIAGHETSATAAAWILALVAQHGALAEPVRGEARIARQATKVAELGALEHSTRWVKEALRLYPAVPLASAMPTRDLRLGRLELPRGTPFDICCYVQHRLPWFWPDPERFDPERFSTPPTFGCFLPFLSGPHTCVGMQLAMVELPLLVSRLVDAFDYELPKGPPRPNMRLSLHPSGLEIRALPRASRA